jgi:REP element-mobilizing transposase RayT
MKEKGFSIRNQYHTHFVTFSVVGWVDVFTRKECRDILIENLKYCIEHKGMLLYGYVIMSNHLHAIMAAQNVTKGLSFLIRDFKSFTSKKLITWILSSDKESRKTWMTDVFRHYGLESGKVDLFQIWTQDNHPMVITQMDFFMQKLNYIHQNPVKAGIVKNAEDYLYSSATNYAGCKDNILDVIVIDNWSDIGYIR